eukprot:356411-Chlamydomonas_euryale.AAC.4
MTESEPTSDATPLTRAMVWYNPGSALWLDTRAHTAARRPRSGSDACAAARMAVGWMGLGAAVGKLPSRRIDGGQARAADGAAFLDARMPLHSVMSRCVVAEE